MTKLSSFEKSDRKFFLEMFPGVQLFAFPALDVTVGIERTGETMGRFAVAIAANDERKFRRKVGEYVVLQRFAGDVTLPVVLPRAEGTGASVDESDVAEQIAFAIS